MNLQKFFNSWAGMTAELRWLRFLCAGLLVLCLLLTYLLAQRPVKTNIIPYTLTQDAWVTSDAGSQSYKESWGLFLANMLGNASPDNVSFISERLAPLLDPKIKDEYMTILHSQAEHIKEDRIMISFEAKKVFFEPTTNKVFVHGNALEGGAGGKQKRVKRTYEFKIVINNYAPLIEWIDSYSDAPRTQDVIEKMNAKLEDKK